MCSALPDRPPIRALTPHLASFLTSHWRTVTLVGTAESSNIAGLTTERDGLSRVGTHPATNSQVRLGTGFSAPRLWPYKQRKERGGKARSVKTDRRSAMTLRINSDAPNFTADTTEGKIDFHQWIG